MWRNKFIAPYMEINVVHYIGTYYVYQWTSKGYKYIIFHGQLAFCKKAVEELAASRIF